MYVCVSKYSCKAKSFKKIKVKVRGRGDVARFYEGGI